MLHMICIGIGEKWIDFQSVCLSFSYKLLPFKSYNSFMPRGILYVIYNNVPSMVVILLGQAVMVSTL